MVLIITLEVSTGARTRDCKDIFSSWAMSSRQYDTPEQFLTTTLGKGHTYIVVVFYKHPDKELLMLREFLPWEEQLEKLLKTNTLVLFVFEVLTPVAVLSNPFSSHLLTHFEIPGNSFYW